MNERIKELAKRLDFPVGLNDPQWAYENKLYEFAELIVRECLEACSRANDIRHFVPPTQEQVVLSCMCEIETAFRS